MPPTANQQLRDRLKSVRAAITEARDEKATALQARKDAKEAFAVAGVDINDADVTKSAEFQAAEQATAVLGRVDDRLADLQKAETGILDMLDESGPPERHNGNGPGARDELTRRTWDGARLLAEGRYRQALADGIFSSTAKFGSVLLGEIANREEMRQFLAPVGTADVASGVFPPDQRGIVSPLLKPLTLLDIIPIGATDSNSVEYVQVTAIPSAAAETAELTLKPEEALTTVDATAPVRTIAGWIKLARQALDDSAGLATLINTLLPYDVRRRIESQMLSGDGAGQNLRGILNTTGIGAPAFVAPDNIADAILRAMTTIILSDGDPNFVAANPLTWQSLLMMRESEAAGPPVTRSGAYLYGSPATMAAQTIWGLTLTANRTVPQASPLVGDANGATLLVREGVNVKVSDSDQDDFVKNRVTVLAEARVAFPVWRPASFAKAALS
ncbi:MAG TPA: phage major capsid protein [Solirubrobacteraceae bacterium]